MRPSICTGASQRNSSSTAVFMSERSSRRRCSSPGWSSNASRPLPMRFVVVSKPAAKSSITVLTSSSWLSWSPCSSTWTSSERRSSVGCARRSAIRASRCSVSTLSRRDRGVEVFERWVELERLHRGAHVRLERGAFLGGNAEHLADHGHRQRQRELGDDVDVAVGVELVEQLVGEAHDVGAQVLDRLRRERLRDESPEARVIGRVETEHRRRSPLEIGKALVPLLLR